jgi:CheY-like chemotaxis protein
MFHEQSNQDTSKIPFKILLVEDDGVTNFITKNKLKNLGFETLLSDKKEAIIMASLK